MKQFILAKQSILWSVSKWKNYYNRPLFLHQNREVWVWDFEWDDTLETGSNIHQISLKAKSKSSHPFKDSHSQKHTLWSPTNIAMTAWWSGSGPEISYARPGQDCDIAGVWDWNTWFEIEKLDAWNILPLFLILLNIHSIFDMASSPWEEL